MASALEDFLRRARRRHVAVAVLEQACLAACAAAIGLLVLLLAGTQILDWHWLAVLFGAALLFGLYRLRGKLPGSYLMAQQVDARLRLHDTLSTAYHFRKDAGATALHQRRDAEEIAGSAPLRAAVPAALPRSTYALAGLIVAAATLFAMRYLVTSSLDLKRPIANITFGTFTQPEPERAESRKSMIQEHFEQQLQQMGVGLDPVDDHPGDNQLPQPAMTATATPDGREPLASDEQSGAPGDKPNEGGDGAEDANEKGPSSASDKAGSGVEDLPGLNVSGKQQPKQNAQGKAPSKTGESSSMLDKMRDAMANLMAKLKMEPPGNQGQQQASNSGGSPSEQASTQQRGASQNKSQGKGQKGDPDGQQGDQMSELAQAGQSKGGDKSDSQPGGEDSKTGMGRQDGNKDIIDAEQLAAMGKISEILGKRSAQLQGEITVEVPSGKQQLKTAYTRRRAAHGDTGGEIAREEIPLDLQPYVQRYFDEIRKVPAKPVETPATPAAKTKT